MKFFSGCPYNNIVDTQCTILLREHLYILYRTSKARKQKKCVIYKSGNTQVVARWSLTIRKKAFQAIYVCNLCVYIKIYKQITYVHYNKPQFSAKLNISKSVCKKKITCERIRKQLSSGNKVVLHNLYRNTSCCWRITVLKIFEDI